MVQIDITITALNVTLLDIALDSIMVMHSAITNQEEMATQRIATFLDTVAIDLVGSILLIMGKIFTLDLISN